MATQFPDVKPWPEPKPAVVEIGSNSVPMEVETVDAFEDALRKAGLTVRISDLVARGKAVTDCASQDAAGRITDFLKMCSVAANAVEAERVTMTAPLLAAQRALKGKADNTVADLQATMKTVRGFLDAFLAEQERARRVEAARVAKELADKAAAADAERRRQQAIEDERAAAENRHAEEVHVEPEPVFTVPVITRAPVRGDYGSTASVRETWTVKVTNIRQVPDQYLKHPAVIEALEKVLGPLVRGKNGLREIKGCEIKSELGSAIR